MKTFEKCKELFKAIANTSVIAFHDFQSSLNDTARMCDADNRIYSLAGGAFCRAFSDIAKQICYTRKCIFADTYCSLAEEAIVMLLKGVPEKDVLYHFDKILIRERGGDADV